MGVTTTQSRSCANDPTAFENCTDSVGNTGRLRGLGNSGDDTSHPPTFLKPDTESLVPDFQALVDVGVYGATEEYGMWVVAEAICASLDMPFDSDFDEGAGDLIYDCHPEGEGTENWNDTATLYEFCSCYPGNLYDYNIDEADVRFMRDNSTLVVIIVSDEGDYTTNMGAAEWPWSIEECEIGTPWPLEIQDACSGNPQVLCENFCKLDVFLEFFAAMDRRVVFAIIGPGAELKVDQQGNITTEAPCNAQNSSVQMMEFYLWAAELTGGLYAPIDVLVDGSEHECTDADFNQTLSDLGQLVMNLGRTWHLNRVPDLDTVMVYVNDEFVPPAECLPNDEECVPSTYIVECEWSDNEPSAGLNGWTYNESTQSIDMHGNCVPDYNQIVDIFYLPQSGSGRPLPF